MYKYFEKNKYDMCVNVFNALKYYIKCFYTFAFEYILKKHKTYILKSVYTDVHDLLSKNDFFFFKMLSFQYNCYRNKFACDTWPTTYLVVDPIF